MRSTVPAACSAIATMMSPAFAQEAAEREDRFHHEGLVESTIDHGEDLDVAALTVEYAAALRLSNQWTLQGSLVLEPVADSPGDSWFENEGLYAETLSIQFNGEAYSLAAGKINPVFGAASAATPGLYGMEIGEEYELVERIGLAGDIDIGALTGAGSSHVLSAAVFTSDRTALSDSLGTRRGRLKVSDGGMGNTEGLESFAVSLDGVSHAGWSYTLGFRMLPAEDPGLETEQAIVAGGSWELQPAEGYGLTLGGELAQVVALEGVSGAERLYHTASATLSRGAWRLSAIATGHADSGFAAGTDLTRLEVSAGRDLPGGFQLDAGLQFSDEEGQSETLVGGRLTWSFG